VVHHRCRGGCASGKINVLIFLDVYPHRPSPMSIRPTVFSLFSAPLRLRAMPKSPRADQIAVKNRSHSSCRASPLWQPLLPPDPHLRETGDVLPPIPHRTPQSGGGPPSDTTCHCCRFFQNQFSHRWPLAPRAPVVHHRCRGGCSSGKSTCLFFRTYILIALHR
jgi:hypothetical protein